MTQPRELEVAPTTMICVIPRTPASTDNLSLQQIYDNQAQYLGTVRRQPTHTELAQMATLHGFRPALPVSAIQWTNRYAQRVILIVASHAEPPVPQLRPWPELCPRAPAVSKPAKGARTRRRAPPLHGAAALPALHRRPDGQRGRHGSPRSVSLVRAR